MQINSFHLQAFVLHAFDFDFLVCPARFERATYALEGRCSIQLSYGQIVNIQVLTRFLHRLTLDLVRIWSGVTQNGINSKERLTLSSQNHP